MSSKFKMNIAIPYFDIQVHELRCRKLDQYLDFGVKMP